MQRASFPVRVSLELTNRCNQSCVACPRDGFTRPLGTMADELFERVAGEVAEHDTMLLLHFLGEPLLHPRLPALVRKAKRLGVSPIVLSTNATLLDEAYSRALIESGLDRLDISVDALDRDAYHSIRGTDDLHRVVANIEGFLAVRTLLGRRSPVVSLQFLAPGNDTLDLHAITERWHRALGPDDFIKAIAPASFQGTFDGGTLPGEEEERTPCAWLFGSVIILQDGTVTMCGADWDARFPLGNLIDSTLAQVWDSSEADRRRQAHLEGRFDEVGECASCTDWHLADGHGYQNVRPGSAARPGPMKVFLDPNRRG